MRTEIEESYVGSDSVSDSENSEDDSGCEEDLNHVMQDRDKVRAEIRPGTKVILCLMVSF
jgi:hypothetical protein